MNKPLLLIRGSFFLRNLRLIVATASTVNIKTFFDKQLLKSQIKFVINWLFIEDKNANS